MDHPGDRNEETSSHTLLTEPVRLEQLHTAFDNDDQTTSSSAKQSTHIEDKESDVEKGISNGEDVDNSAAAENIESKKEEAQNTAVMPNEKEKDPNLVGWEGLVASSPDVQINPTEHSLQVLTTLKILRIGPRARNTESLSSTPS
jgi:hypothetical protein